VFLPTEDSADTAAAEQQLMVRNDRGADIRDSETHVWPERLLVTTPRLRPSVLLRSSRFMGHEKRMGGQRESTTSGNLAQMYCVRLCVTIAY